MYLGKGNINIFHYSGYYYVEKLHNITRQRISRPVRIKFSQNPNRKHVFSLPDLKHQLYEYSNCQQIGMANYHVKLLFPVVSSKQICSEVVEVVNASIVTPYMEDQQTYMDEHRREFAFFSYSAQSEGEAGVKQPCSRDRHLKSLYDPTGVSETLSLQPLF